MLDINTENSAKHWEFINVKDRTVLDLGCGRWNKVEYVEDSWLTTPEHFIKHGASKVIACDTDFEEIEWFNNKFGNDNRYLFILQNISGTEDIEYLYDKYKPDCVKCDIEGNEMLFLGLSKKLFGSVQEYYIETHNDYIYNKFIDVFKCCDFNIREQINLVHASPCKVIFAHR